MLKALLFMALALPLRASLIYTLNVPGDGLPAGNYGQITLAQTGLATVTMSLSGGRFGGMLGFDLAGSPAITPGSPGWTMTSGYLPGAGLGWFDYLLSCPGCTSLNLILHGPESPTGGIGFNINDWTSNGTVVLGVKLVQGAAGSTAASGPGLPAPEPAPGILLLALATMLLAWRTAGFRGLAR